MARPRKSRLVPSLSTFAEELVRVLTEHVDRAVSDARRALEVELRQLRREVRRARVRGAEPAAGPSGRPRSRRHCSVRGCTSPHVARGLCKNHYQRLRYAERKINDGGT
ncbi:MAG TPA: hypothetical protein VMZ28_26785 [Kofleriaceae bacterium]|nr:hypothetical protein [Kofleriaceae bacterium]